MPDLENSLMNPNQLRHFGVEVQDNPFHRDPMVIRKDDEDDGNGFEACLKTQGTVIYLDTWTPTDSDLREFPHVQLTSSAEWNPNDIALPGQSAADIQETESRNVSKVDLNSRRMIDSSYGDPHSQAMKI
jgi:hypothetical protein